MASFVAISGASSWRRTTMPVNLRGPKGTITRAPTCTRWRQVAGREYVKGRSSGTGKLTSQNWGESKGTSILPCGSWLDMARAWILLAVLVWTGCAARQVPSHFAVYGSYVQAG